MEILCRSKILTPLTRIYCVTTRLTIRPGLVIGPSSVPEHVGVNKKMIFLSEKTRLI
jgi:hypothetical protein